MIKIKYDNAVYRVYGVNKKELECYDHSVGSTWKDTAYIKIITEFLICIDKNKWTWVNTEDCTEVI